jgi:hypothetical protein
MRVTVVVDAFRPVPGAPTVVAPRAFHEVDTLAAAIGDALRIEVPVVEAGLAAAPADGYLVVFGMPRDLDRALGSRIVAFDEDRAHVMQTVEAFDLAAAVESHRYWTWRQGTDDRPYALVGRKDVAERMGARLVDSPYTSARYSAIASDAARNFIGLLAAYLRAYS